MMRLGDFLESKFKPEEIRKSQALFYEDALRAQIQRAEQAEERVEDLEMWKSEVLAGHRVGPDGELL